MNLFFKEIQVKPNQIGFVFRNNVFEKSLEPGVYKFLDWKDRIQMIALPTNTKLMQIGSQEVLTKDNVALRFSFSVLYKITNGELFLKSFEIAYADAYPSMLMQAEARLHQICQLTLRNKIAEMDSEQLNEKRLELTNFKTEEMEQKAAELGIEIEEAQLRDLTFPKSIQDLFSKHLEAKIRAKADLENARTAVATARALKNASELMKGDDNLKFFQLLETINKIADKGKHTFMIGDLNQLAKTNA